MTFEELQYIVTLMREEVARRQAAYDEVKKPVHDLKDGYLTPDELGENVDDLLRRYEERREQLSQAEAYLSLFLSRGWKL